MSALWVRFVRRCSRALYPSAPDREFDAAWYLARYPDVAEQLVDAWTHFVLVGDAEERAPNARFDPASYARIHLAPGELRPYRRYITTGRRFGLLPAPVAIGAEASRVRLRRMLAARRHPVLILGDDAQPDGSAPWLIETGLRMRSLGFDPVFLLTRGGPRLGELLAIGPATIAAEGWDLGAMGEELPLTVPVLAGAASSSAMLTRLGRDTSSDPVDRVGSPGMPSPRLPRRRPLRAAITRVHVAVAGSLPVSRLGSVRAIPSFAVQVVGSRHLRIARAPRRIPASVAIHQGPLASPGALRHRAAVAAVGDGEAVTLASPSLLRSMSVPFALHIVRDQGLPVWPLVDAVQRASRRIVSIEQVDAASAPPWARRHEPPPTRSRGQRPASAPIPGLPLAECDPIALERPVGVFLHIHYPELAGELITRVAGIEHPVRCYISTDDERKVVDARRLLPEAEIRVFPNRGRDVYPKVFGYADAHADHDVVLHLHTKRSPHHDSLQGWNEHILDRVLPSARGVNAILALFGRIDGLGMVSPSMPAHWPAQHWWGHNRAIADTVLWGAGWPPLPSSDRLRFPAGSMFWARSAALAPVQALAPPAEAFLPGAGGVDGTLAHTVERLIGVGCEVAGLAQFFVDAQDAAHPATPPLTTADVAELLGRR